MNSALPRLLAAVALAATPLPALAAGTAKIVSNEAKAAGRVMTVTWADDNNVRIEAEGSPGYMIERDGHSYIVIKEHGRTMVLAMDEMRKTLGKMGARAGAMAGAFKAPTVDTPSFGKIDHISDTGKPETVAGFSGEVYKVTYTDPNGKTETDDWVLTDAAPVVEMTHVFLTMTRNAFPNAKAVAARDAWVEQLPKDRRGILRAGKDIRLEIADQRRAPAQRLQAAGAADGPERTDPVDDEGAQLAGVVVASPGHSGGASRRRRTVVAKFTPRPRFSPISTCDLHKMWWS